jgi:hypothetical protein
MAQPTVASKWQGDKGRRRSMRVLLTLPVSIRGTLPDGNKFNENTYTLVVNAHGALITLSASVTQGQHVLIANKATQAQLDCRVVFIGQAQAGKTHVGLEFVQPSPSFWQINFPPDDWGTSQQG